MTSIYWILSFALIGALIGTALLRRYALSNSLIDIPNSRSSHTLPTPRGGGVAIVVSFLVSAVLLSVTGLVPWSIVRGVVIPGALVALVGFLDDHGHVPARWRLLGHFTAAALAMFILGGLPVLQFFNISMDLGWFGYGVGAVFLVWLLNLYNFMDGIDGLASLEAIFVAIGGTLLYVLTNTPEFAWLPITLALSVSGFLYWNFPPARIFMGDAGSGFLGITLGVLSLHAALTNPVLLWSWLILLGVFIVDATCTLFVRLLRGEKVYEAHRSHAYQIASRRSGSHRRVALSVVGINFIWLLPLSVLVCLGFLDGFLGLLIAYAPLVVVALRLKAGQRDS
jgi:Fuc2NAc and GlcNAc transferase